MLPRKLSERPSYRVNDDLYNTPKRTDHKIVDKHAFVEGKLAFYGLLISLVVISAKIYYANSKQKVT